MWQRLSPRARWGLLVALVALALAALDVWWFETYRHNFPFDVDEAGYTTFGLVDYLGLKSGGIGGWWEAIQNQPTFAPLVPAVTSLLVFVKPGLLDGFATLTFFAVVLALAAYAIGERLAGPRLGALAAIVTATLPGTFAFSREYIFALPTAAFLSLAVFFLLKSEGMRRSRWAAICGVAVGLMLLSRTMAISYVPGLLVAALVAILARREGDLPKRFLNLGLTALVAVAVAATWYARNLQSVIDYLTNYGYGSQSKNYGKEHALLSWGRFHSVAEHMTTEDLFLPLALLFLVALAALAVLVLRRLGDPDSRASTWRRLAASDALSVAIVFVLGYGALMTSQNGGDGFTFPIAALLPCIAVLAIKAYPRAAVPAAGLVGLIAAVNLVSTATIWSFASHTRLVSVPGFEEPFPVTKGVPKAVFAIRLQVPGPETVFDRRDEGWPRADREVTGLLAGLYGPHGEGPVVAFASRNRAISSNTVQLATVGKYHRGIFFTQLSAEPNDSVRTYRRQLSDPAFGQPTVLMTTSSNAGDFPPLVTQAYAIAAAKQLGFRRIHTLTLPDGRRLAMWRKRPAGSDQAPQPRQLLQQHRDRERDDDQAGHG